MKKYIIGLLAGILIGSAGMTAAATNSTVQATIAKFTFSINGEKQILKGDPLVYKGTTYLPVREVALMTGYDLEFDSKAKSINLKEGGGLVTTKESNEWISARDVVKAFPVSIKLNSQDTTISYNETTLVFPYSFKTNGTDGVYKNSEGTASIKISESSIYLGRDTLDILGITF
ncbi:stalk domain-containing protein [Paenibacillus sp. sgz500958]|uniref:stalk domain-containing protein n=1 Tax=Paenibacillus sp. sgz500958 TaxID=3242475 RepID=UPI0036D40DF7